MLTAFGRANHCSDTQDLIDELAGHIGVTSDYVLLDNGSVDVIAAIVRATVTSGHDVILTVCAGELFVDIGATCDSFYPRQVGEDRKARQGAGFAYFESRRVFEGRVCRDF
jgi:hypothetical protein